MLWREQVPGRRSFHQVDLGIVESTRSPGQSDQEPSHVTSAPGTSPSAPGTRPSAGALKGLCVFLKQLVPVREAGKETKMEMQELKHPALEER